MVNLGGRVLENDRVKRTLCFVIIYIVMIMLSISIMTFLGMDSVTAFGSSISALSNIGPGAGLTGPASNYSEVDTTIKWLMSFYMLVGRLEIYTVLFLFMPSFYKK